MEDSTKAMTLKKIVHYRFRSAQSNCNVMSNLYFAEVLCFSTCIQKPPITERARKLTHVGSSVWCQSLMGTRVSQLLMKL